MTSRSRQGVARRWVAGGVVCLVALFVVTSCLALTRRPAAPPFSARPAGATAVDELGPQRPSMLFVGDSYAAGKGTDGPRTAYSCLTAKIMNWVCNLDAQGGTGYVGTGAPNGADFGPFISRLSSDANRYRADVIIVDGGRNDVDVHLDTEIEAAQNYLQQLRAQWPHAVLVVLVPAYLNSTPETFPFALQFGDQLRRIVPEVGGIVIDPLAEGWTSPANVDTLMDPDGIHPNAAGHRYLADRLSSELRARGLANVPITDDAPSQPQG